MSTWNLTSDKQPPVQASEPQTQSQSPALALAQSSTQQKSPQAPSPANVQSKTPTGPAPRIRRRNRMITSCLECRRRKLKCDKSHPCTNCSKFTRDCVFLAPAVDQASQLKLTEIKEKVGSLERMLERDAVKPTTSTTESGTASRMGTFSIEERTVPDDADDDLPVPEDERNLEPTPMATQDATYEYDGGEDDDMLDLGFQLGKMRVTDRIGGFNRPKMAKELDLNPDAQEGQSSSSPMQGVASWMKPGPAYVAPSSGFFFGRGNQEASLIDFLPSRLAGDRLVKQYFLAVHPISLLLHRPTFEKEYETFWDEVSLGIEPPNSVQAVVFAVMFSGVVSMDEATCFRDFGVSKASLTDNFKVGTETALARANFLRTTKVQTLQGFVIYLVPCCRAELSRAHTVLIAAAIRIAECMGLHRDGEEYGLNPLEIHVRRLIWHTLCFLDIRGCEATGPRPGIHREDFDCKLPLNIDDVQLHPTGKPPESVDRFTDSTLALIRFEVNEMMRTIWVDRPKIEKRKISLTTLLTKIEKFRTDMTAKYDHLMDERVPVQKSAKVVKALLMSRLQVMVLHRYHNSVKIPMPTRLRDILVNSATLLIEYAIYFETDPEIHTWAWYGGALTQYHVALLLLLEIISNPDRREADRIWRCIDYIFERDPAEPRPVKARNIVGEAQHKFATYSERRALRVPLQMNKYAYKNAVSPEVQAQVTTEPYQPRPELSPSSSVGRAPVESMMFHGSTRGQPLVSLSNIPSPPAESGSDTSSMRGGPPMMPMANPLDDPMADIDWHALDVLFPPDQIGAQLGGPSFELPAFRF